MSRILLLVVLAWVLSGIQEVLATQDQSASYQQHCFLYSDATETELTGTLFLFADGRLWKTGDDWNLTPVLPSSEFTGFGGSRTFNPQLLWVYEQGTVAAINAAGHRLHDFTWQADWTAIDGLTSDDRLVIERRSGNSATNGISLLSLDASIIAYSDYPNALTVPEDSSLFQNLGFHVSPDGRYIVYDAFFERENDFDSQRGFVLADISGENEIWRTETGNHIWGNIWSHPHWSPDASQFAYVHHEHESFELEDIEIALVDLSGRERIVTDFNVSGYTYRYPDWLQWSPDGRKIAFWMENLSPPDMTQMTGSTWRPPAQPTLHVYDLDMNIVYDLCIERPVRAGFSGSLIWSPDSRFITFGTHYMNTLNFVDLAESTFFDGPVESRTYTIVGWLTG